MIGKHVICAISGGVDSAVSAYLLKQKGYRVTGCFMRNWNKLDEDFRSCNIDSDEEDARSVCQKLEIPFLSVDFSKNYWNRIFSQFLTDYEEGFTPNPDILCNKYVKFPSLFKYCSENLKDFDFIATGHYARLSYDGSLKKYRLLKSTDELKDQSFFLSQIDPKLLDRVMFPVGNMDKDKVKQIAATIGLGKISSKSSSVGICFIGKRKFSGFINNYLTKKVGCVIDLETGESLGEHEGIYHFTIGQRIPINERFNIRKIAYFVAKKNFQQNVLYVVKDTNHPALYHNSFLIEKPHWICENKEDSNRVLILDDNYDFKFQYKHYQTPIKSLTKLPDAETGRINYLVKTKFNFRGITPGQYAVFYDNEECIGSGRIVQTTKSLYEQNYNGSIVNSDKMFNKKFKS